MIEIKTKFVFLVLVKCIYICILYIYIHVFFNYAETFTQQVFSSIDINITFYYFNENYLKKLLLH